MIMNSVRLPPSPILFSAFLKNQSTNLSKSLASYLSFTKDHFVFQKNSSGLPWTSLPSQTLEPKLLLPATDNSSSHGSFLWALIFLTILIVLHCPLIFLGVHERYMSYYIKQNNISFDAKRWGIMS